VVDRHAIRSRFQHLWLQLKLQVLWPEGSHSVAEPEQRGAESLWWCFNAMRLRLLRLQLLGLLILNTAVRTGRLGFGSEDSCSSSEGSGSDGSVAESEPQGAESLYCSCNVMWLQLRSISGNQGRIVQEDSVFSFPKMEWVIHPLNFYLLKFGMDCPSRKMGVFYQLGDFIEL
jgi:hypothetical protein